MSRLLRIIQARWRKLVANGLQCRGGNAGRSRQRSVHDPLKLVANMAGHHADDQLSNIGWQLTAEAQRFAKLGDTLKEVRLVLQGQPFACAPLFDGDGFWSD